MDDATIIGSGGSEKSQRIGGFVILGKLGEGGMGAVYKAHDPTLDRTVAIKLLPPHVAGNSDFISRFKREAMAAAKLSHSNIVQVHAAGEDGGAHFIVMEFVEGRTLHDHIARHPHMDCTEALAITVHVAEALRYAWNKARIIHRDIKPANILLSNDGEVKVADLGLAKSLQAAAASVTSTGTIMGSAQYISPEQARGDKEVDFHSDIYSLGCTLFHMLAGRLPFEGEETMALLFKHVNEPPPDLRQVRPDCPVGVAALVKRMMAKNANQRPASYDALVAELTALHAAAIQTKSEPLIVSPSKPVISHAEPTLVAQSPAAPAAPRNPILLYAGVASVAVIAVIGFMVWAPWEKAVAPTGVPGKAAVGTKTTTDDVFIKKVAALPAEQQVRCVMAKLKELNPDFDLAAANEKHQIYDGIVTSLTFVPIGLRNISPVRALTKLNDLQCGGRDGIRNSSPLEDLSPLRGMHLTGIGCAWTSVKDLSPLAGMPLKWLGIEGTGVRDLSALRGMSLKWLWIRSTPISDLSLLQGMPLEKLYCDNCAIGDLSPLTGMPLNTLDCTGNPFTNLTPIKNLPIEKLNLSFKAEHDAAILRSMKSLKTINELPTAEFWKQVDAAHEPVASASAIAATKDAPFVNTLGMKFVPVPGTQVLFSIWETRVRDYTAYARGENVNSWWTQQVQEGVPISREPEDPVCTVSWDDATAFCEWLTKKESMEGKLPKGMKYRLPTDEEWSNAVGLRFEAGPTPKDRSGKNSVDFPWGTGFPPPKPKVGNYADTAFHEKFPDTKDPKAKNWIEGYTDGFATTAPVGSFPANEYGIYDLGGNVWEWCEDLNEPGGKDRLARGASWSSSDPNGLLSSARHRGAPTRRNDDYGFRCVLAPAAATGK